MDFFHLDALVLYFLSFMDAFSIMMIVPQLPSFALSLGVDTVTLGFVSSIYGFLQLFMALVVGRAGDVYGRKTVMIFSLGASSLGYLLLGVTTNLSLFIASRV